MKVIVFLPLLLVGAGAADCTEGTCKQKDETSLLQVSNSMKLGTERVQDKQMPQMPQGMPQMPQGMPMQMPQGMPMQIPMGAAPEGGAPQMMILPGQMPPMAPQAPQQGAMQGLAPGMPTVEQFAEMLQQQPQTFSRDDPGKLQVTNIALPKDLMPRGLHPGAEVPGMRQDGNIQLTSMNQMPQMTVLGAQEPFQGGMQQGMPQMMAAPQGAAPPGVATVLVPVAQTEGDNSELDEMEEGEEDQSEAMSEDDVESVVSKVMDTLGSKKAEVTDAVVDRVIKVLGEKKRKADKQKAAAEAAEQARKEQIRSFERTVEKRLAPKVEEKVRAKVEAKVRQEFAQELAAKKKKREVREQTLSEMALAEEEAANKAAELNSASENREKEIAKAAAEKAAAEKVAAAAQKAVAQAASRAAAAQRAAAAAEKVVASLNRRTQTVR